jgi:hypothetical protein
MGHYEERYLDAATIRERVAWWRARATRSRSRRRPRQTGDKTVFATELSAAQEPGWHVTGTSSRSATRIRWRRRHEPGATALPVRRSEEARGTEMVSVRAGLFKAKHYRYRTAYGETVDYWIDDSVAPIGLVKLEASRSSTRASAADSSSSWSRPAAARSRRSRVRRDPSMPSF